MLFRSQIPLYGLYSFPLSKKMSLNFKGGYMVTKNQLDPQAKSDLDREGFRQTSEKLESYWFYGIGIEFKSSSKYAWFCNYNIEQTSGLFSSDIVNKKNHINVSNIEFGIKIFTSIL